MKSKKAAMELTMGTIVTIVLLVAVLVVVLFFINKIRESGVNAIDGIDQAVRSEVEKLFAEDSTKKIVIYPSTREIKIKKGEDSRGFGLSIRNIEDEGRFSYEITAHETDCGMRLPEAEDLIALNKQRNNILIPGGSIMEDPIFVKFNIPESTPPCMITYVIDMKKDGSTYGASTDVYLKVESK
ncbi:MAG: hypothetical protein ABH811_00885 [archaeon]